MATITLAALRAIVREIAEQETVAPTTALVDDTELDERINEAVSLLRDLQIQLGWTENVDVAVQTIATVSGTTDYALSTSPAFYELLGVRSLDGSQQHQLTQWHFPESAHLRASYHSPQPGQYKYRVVGTKLVLLPTPKAVHTIYVDFIPEYTKLTAGVDLSVPFGWHKWACYLAAIDIVNKERLPIDGLVARWKAEDERIRAHIGRRDASSPPRVITRRGRSGNAMARRLGLPSLPSSLWYS